jgi:hypothetical protein
MSNNERRNQYRTLRARVASMTGADADAVDEALRARFAPIDAGDWTAAVRVVFDECGGTAAWMARQDEAGFEYESSYGMDPRN